MEQSAFALHESLPLQLLGYSNLGRPNGNHKTPRFATASTPSTLTVGHLLYNPREFGIARWAITTDRRFIINFIVRPSLYPLEACVNLKELHLGSDNSVRNHRCLSTRIYGLFRHDVDARINRGFTQDEEEEMEADCAE
ncbi:hypothetical protein V5O48_019726, partial [Marasmius crinis-equi]